MTFTEGHKHGVRFKKGHSPWNTGKRAPYSPERIAQLRAQRLGKKATPETKAKLSAMRKGEKHPFWSGDKVSYGGSHTWLIKNFSKPDKCENAKCEGRSKLLEFAHKPNFPYLRRRDHFVVLCRSCHRKMDFAFLTGGDTEKFWQEILGTEI